MIDELERGIKESIGAPPEGGQQKFYGVVVGKVINPLDPLMLGRVQVQTPFVDSLDLSPWARIAQGMAGPLHGNYFVPNLGDEVLLAFEHGDVNAPYILGSLANMISRPPLPSPVPQIRAIRTLVGNQIVFMEAPPSITVQTPCPPGVAPLPPSPAGPHQPVRVAADGIQVMGPTMITLQCGASSIVVTPASITLTCGGSSIALTAAGINVLSPLTQVTGTETVGIAGKLVRINS